MRHCAQLWIRFIIKSSLNPFFTLLITGLPFYFSTQDGTVKNEIKSNLISDLVKLNFKPFYQSIHLDNDIISKKLNIKHCTSLIVLHS
jgi:hypothetical protein